MLSTRMKQKSFRDRRLVCRALVTVTWSYSRSGSILGGYRSGQTFTNQHSRDRGTPARNFLRRIRPQDTLIPFTASYDLLMLRQWRTYFSDGELEFSNLGSRPLTDTTPGSLAILPCDPRPRDRTRSHRVSSSLTERWVFVFASFKCLIEGASEHAFWANTVSRYRPYKGQGGGKDLARNGLRGGPPSNASHKYIS